MKNTKDTKDSKKSTSNSDIVEDLEYLCSYHSVVSDTATFIKYLQARLEKQNISTQVTPFGVLLAGCLKSPKLLISAHVDEVGFQVTKRNNDGSFTINKAGLIDSVMLNNSAVYVQTANGPVMGAIYPQMELGKNNPEHFSEIYLDVTNPDSVSIGDFGSYQRSFHYDHTTNKIIATGLDNKIGVKALLDMLENNSEWAQNTLFVFATEEETTNDCLRGIAHQFQPEYGLVVDMCPVHQRGAHQTDVLPQVGSGPAIAMAFDKYKLHESVRKRVLPQLKTSFQASYFNINCVPEPQLLHSNGVTKGVNIMVPMLGWHNVTYSMQLSDYVKLLDLVREFRKIIFQ